MVPDFSAQASRGSLKFEKMSSKKLQGSAEKSLSPEEQQVKINDIRKLIGPIADKLPALCSDASISRYLRARNWNTKKASKMLKETLKWRLDYKPEKIRWEDIAHEAETGKIYRANYFDKHGRTVLIMRPGFQNTNSTRGQIRYLVYCLENAIMNLKPDQEQMVWLIDFQGWNTSSISIKMVKPFIEPKTFKKVKFVYSDNAQSQKIMEELFDMGKLESAFGGRNKDGFDYKAYREWIREDDRKKLVLIKSEIPSPSHALSIHTEPQQTASLAFDNSLDDTDEDGFSSSEEMASPQLDSVDEKVQGQNVDCNDAANVGDGSKDAANVGDATKRLQLN
ncbi:uncharacterized protein LOC131144080 isoform X3 [Malania oleifera]|uniref:uncharacterized protein LOC131144080 isoform X3 n=1 Tax=Malania oleifera TaxID=397392 RepID=UPI0025AE2FA5|nr:uncharacterized protein LOC131144080 isoform X3 [Malania oleifera]